MATRQSFNTQLSTTNRQRRDAVWKGSRRGDVAFVPISRERRRALWSRVKRNPKFDKLARHVFNTLLFDFLNTRTGRLDPTWQTVARAAACSVSTVYRRLKLFRRHKLLDWITRCSGVMVDGRYMMQQDSNAYFVNASWGEQPTPPPDPASWGQTPPLPGWKDTTARTPAELQRVLELEPDDPLAATLARIGARLPKSEI